jgi:hypothetical protein
VQKLGRLCRANACAACRLALSFGMFFAEQEIENPAPAAFDC